MNREEKQHAVDSLHETLKVSRTILLAGFEGLKVTQAVELRRKMAAAGARYQVVKNRLLERAAKGTPAEDVAQGLKGTTSMSYTEEDPVALAKLVVEYAKANQKFSFKAGMGGRVRHFGARAESAGEPPVEGDALRADGRGR